MTDLVAVPDKKRPRQEEPVVSEVPGPILEERIRSAECKICIEQTLHVVKCCNSGLCRTCLEKHISTSLSSRKAPACPLPACRRGWSFDNCFGYVAVDKYRLLNEVIESSRIPAGMRVSCKTVDCGAPMLKRQGLVRCNLCLTDRCGQCGDGYSDGHVCSKDDVISVPGLEIQKCRCGTLVHRAMFCNKMTCLACRRVFCFKCNTDYASGLQKQCQCPLYDPRLADHAAAKKGLADICAGYRHLVPPDAFHRASKKIDTMLEQPNDDTGRRKGFWIAMAILSNVLSYRAANFAEVLSDFAAWATGAMGYRELMARNRGLEADAAAIREKLRSLEKQVESLQHAADFLSAFE